MKKNLIQIILLLLPISNFAQANVYHPFPDTNTVWKCGDTYICGCQSTQIQAYSDYQYIISGDTLIGIYNYKKIFRSGWTSNVFISTCGCYGTYFNYYLGGLRQDTLNKRVYFKLSTNPETLIYDFSKTVGDTLHLSNGATSYTCAINSIDSVLVGTNYHKRFNVNAGVAFIEEVGSTAGFLGGINIISTIPYPHGSYLTCFSHNTDIYPNTSTSCPLITNPNDISQFQNQENTLILFPNPSNDKITLQSSTELGVIIIYNALGEIVLQTKSLHPSPTAGGVSTQGKNLFTIDISKFPAGIYTVQAVGRYMKLVKE